MQRTRKCQKFDDLSEQLTAIVRDVHGLPIFNLGTMYDCMEHRDEWHLSNSGNNKKQLAQAVGVAYHLAQMIDYVRLTCWGSRDSTG